MMKFWTLKDKDNFYYVGEFFHLHGPYFTNLDASAANMGRKTMQDFYNDDFVAVEVEINEVKK